MAAKHTRLDKLEEIVKIVGGKKIYFAECSCGIDRCGWMRIGKNGQWQRVKDIDPK